MLIFTSAKQLSKTAQRHHRILCLKYISVKRISTRMVGDSIRRVVYTTVLLFSFTRYINNQFLFLSRAVDRCIPSRILHVHCYFSNVISFCNYLFLPASYGHQTKIDIMKIHPYITYNIISIIIFRRQYRKYNERFLICLRRPIKISSSTLLMSCC